MRGLADPKIEFMQDHLAIGLDRQTGILTMSGSFVVPYSTIQAASVETPSVPALTENWLTGLYFPQRVAKGRFHGWHGKRSFLWLEGHHTRALVLALVGHPQYDAVAIASPEADAWLARLEHARKEARG